MQVTFEKRGKYLHVWVEPVVNPKPKAEPPVVELRLSLTNIVHGRPVRGPVAVGVGTPCAYRLRSTLLPLLTRNFAGSIQYHLARFDRPQSEIIARRQRAYRRQELIAASQPDAEDTVDVAKAIAEDLRQDAQELAAQPETVDAQTTPPL